MSTRRTFRIAVRKFDPFESAIRIQWDTWNVVARSGLTLEIVPMELLALYEALFVHQGLRSGDWDVAFIDTDWVAAAHTSRAVLDLVPYIAENPPEDYPHGWTPSLLRLHTIDDAVLGFPYHDGPECLIYRKDLFENPTEQAAYLKQFGVPLQVPQNWDAFRQAAQFFQRPSQGIYGTVFAAFPDGHNTVYDFLLQLWTRGGELVDISGKARFTGSEMAAALSFYRELLQDGSLAHPLCRSMDSVQAGLAFAAGEVAMMVNWFGFAALAETMEGSNVKGRVDIAPIPCAAGASSTSLNIYWLLTIAAGSPHPRVAYDFLRHCASPAMDKLLTLGGGVGCRRSTWTDPQVNAIAPFFHRLERLHATARELPQMPAWPRIASIIEELVLRVLETDASVEQLMRQADEKADNGIGNPIQ